MKKTIYLLLKIRDLEATHNLFEKLKGYIIK